jgi:putative CocE/NonD family hydrolase
MDAVTSRPAAVTVEFDVPARMRDGVTLRANVYRPAGSGPWPTLLTRLPYDKDDPLLLSFVIDPIVAAREGFMVVVQDTRGRFASEGEWVPFQYEREDGYDSVEWAARLPGSNGRVGMFGCSYFGNSQWLAAIEQPPALAAISPGFTWSEPLDGVYARGGALELGLMLPWGLETGAAHIAREPLAGEERMRRLEALFDDFDALARDGYLHLPIHETTVVSRHGVPDTGALRVQEDPDAAETCRVAGGHERVTVPSFNIGGWYDIFLQGTLDNHVAMAALGRRSRLLIGPWGHDEASLTDPVGDLCFGIRASALGVPAHPHGDLAGEQLAWLRGHLDPAAPAGDESSEALVRIFVMGRNEWRDERSWPLERARPERWSLAADGALVPGAARDDGQPSRFVYDPADPVPTLGGQIGMKPAYSPGPFEQARIEARDDVLVFTSEPLRADLEVTGPVQVVLHAESSAPSTDWVARLCDVHPDGRSFNLCDGIVRIEQGADELRRVEIDLWATSNVFLTGHRIRVHVTSSSFPRWDRNLNTGDQRDSRIEVARQRIHHDAQHPSYVELPVIP